jgi:hypothetical protein
VCLIVCVITETPKRGPCVPVGNERKMNDELVLYAYNAGVTTTWLTHVTGATRAR